MKRKVELDGGQLGGVLQGAGGAAVLTGTHLVTLLNPMISCYCKPPPKLIRLKVETFSYFQAMKKSRFSEKQIIGILNQVEAGSKVQDVCGEHGLPILVAKLRAARRF